MSAELNTSEEQKHWEAASSPIKKDLSVPGLDDEDDDAETKTLNLRGVQARVDRVNVEGVVRTKDDIIKKSVKDLFKAKNFEELIIEAHYVRHKLERLGCFKNIAIHVDISEGPKATPNGYEVTYHVQEMKRMTAGVKLAMDTTNESGVILGLNAPNILGRGEMLQAEYTYGPKNTQTYNVTLSKPFVNRWNPVLSSSLFNRSAEWPASGYKLIERGLLVDLAFATFHKFQHSLQWHGSWRELGVGKRYAAFEVRENAGNTLKSALRHILTVDKRNSPIFPSCGSLMQFSTELAGLGGNIGFLKNDVVLQKNFRLFSDVSIQATLTGGILNTLDTEKEINVCDNYFLGGPLTLRGFNIRGVGPMTDGSFIGAKVFWSGALHLYTPLPFRLGAGGLGDFFRTHIFLNAGNIGDFETKDDLKEMYEEQVNSMRFAWGIGLALRIAQMARVELNYCFPIWFQETDSVCNGVQFGIGVQFI